MFPGRQKTRVEEILFTVCFFLCFTLEPYKCITYSKSLRKKQQHKDIIQKYGRKYQMKQLMQLKVDDFWGSGIWTGELLLSIYYHVV